MTALACIDFYDPTGYRVLSDTDKRSIEYDIKQMYENDIINRANSSSSSTSILNNSGMSSTTSKTTTTTTSTNLTSSSKSNTKKNEQLWKHF
ncbi:unnamed protein product [Rotaria sordida]|uniref:Uncharacterized protein n=1 Tax=Rotaria sordida TaxID=392033 RepID=A0A820CW95_9BILA|nr:unnamed protein product [Rotaria sordida]